MNSQDQLFILTLLASAMSGVHVYPSGAPPEQCQAMTPQHNGNQPLAGSNAPYRVTASKATYSAGDVISVTVQGMDSTRIFKGLMLQARDTSEKRVGTFSLLPGDVQLKLLACDGVPGSAVTHTGRTPKSSINVTWTAPVGNAGNIVLRATVVEQYNTFYVGILSAPIASSVATGNTGGSSSNGGVTNSVTTNNRNTGNGSKSAICSSSGGSTLLFVLVSALLCSIWSRA